MYMQLKKIEIPKTNKQRNSLKEVSRVEVYSYQYKMYLMKAYCSTNIQFQPRDTIK